VCEISPNFHSADNYVFGVFKAIVEGTLIFILSIYLFLFCKLFWVFCFFDEVTFTMLKTTCRSTFPKPNLIYTGIEQISKWLADGRSQVIHSLECDITVKQGETTGMKHMVIEESWRLQCKHTLSLIWTIL
jgi:hypothetical protein